eukprot:1101597-Prorocentrum_lima.AAC.1
MVCVAQCTESRSAGTSRACWMASQTASFADCWVVTCRVGESPGAVSTAVVGDVASLWICGST